MSTSDDYDVAKSFAASRCGLIFEYYTPGHSKGVEIAAFSMYPGEREFLYPPLTYLLLDTSKMVKRMEDGTIKVYVTPQWSQGISRE